jgi:ATP-dependent DNA helicase DinG
LKGRANYLCLARAERFARSPLFANREEASWWPELSAWAEETETGDRAELDLPDQFAAWKDLSATGESCLGRECERYEECFVNRARARAAQAQVVLVNHHLFFADLAMRTSRAGAEVIPDYEAVVFDEAHALEDVATEYFGLHVSSWRVDELARDAERAVADRPDLARAMKAATEELRRAGEKFFGAVVVEVGGRSAPPHTPRSLRSGPDRSLPPLAGAPDFRATLTPGVLRPLAALQERLDAALDEVRAMLAEDAAPALAQVARRAGEIRVELRAVTALAEPRRVFFAEARGRGVFLRAAPVDVSEELVERLYRRVDTAVFTSATLAAQGRFDYFRRRVGLAPEMDVDEARHAGPFDYSTQAALVVPRGLPDPTSAEFGAAAAAAVRELTAITGGRAFVLCTSVRQMRYLREACRDLPYRLLLQGERPKHRLLEAFRDAPSVLFATQSFWEGVDVPGEALSLVVIDKLPFAPPNDPVVQARVRAAEAAGGDGFSDLQVPAAALALRQGFGRLVRSRRDRGLVALLDRRVVTRGYGKAFLATLPACPLLASVDEARAWWERGERP